MSIHEEVELLRNIPMFSKLQPSKLKLIAFTSRRVSFKAGDELFKQGEMGDTAYVLISGAADVIVEGGPQGPVKVLTVGQNQIVGEIAILRDVPRTATVVATAPTDVLVITKDLFFSLLREFPEIGIEMLRHLADRLDRTTTRLRQLVADQDTGGGG